ncbi:MAG: Hpt domain-containing protein [Burkholderiales bacterium]|nr:Hpt domain-containing protein [Burkholderiales bacterium]
MPIDDSGNTALRAAMNAIPALDAERGLRFAAGRVDHYIQRLRKYASCHTDIADELRAAQAYRDPVELGHIAHTLRGVAAVLGARELQQSATDLETGLREGQDWRASASAVARVCAAHQALLEAIAALPETAELETAA